MTLVAWWPLTETSGDVLDYSGTGNDGSVGNGVTRGITGPLGYNAYDFTGTSDRVTSPAIPFDQQGAWSISLWANFASPGDNSYHPACGTDIFRESSIHVRRSGASDSGIVATASDGSTQYTSSANEIPEADRWYHIVGAYYGDSSFPELYIDGVDAAETTFSGSGDSNNDNFTIGASQGASNDQVGDSKVSDVRIYDRVLTPQEVSYLYEISQSGRVRFSSKTSE